MKYASIGPIATFFPERAESNEFLQESFPAWDMDVIYSKTGIANRYIAEPEQCASDLGVAACKKLFDTESIDPSTIDFLILCTQTPDYPLPTTSCLMQQRLGLRESVGAFDFNLGCSGFVYGLAMADGLIRTGSTQRILLVTAETYSKYIDPTDRSLRTIFGDAGVATLIEASDEQSLSAFKYGTDGSGADTLLVTENGARPSEDAIKPRHRKRWPSDLYMDGPSLINFAVEKVPSLMESVLDTSNLKKEDIDCFLFHQATRKLLSELRKRLQIDEARFPISLDRYGNTVSSTIPILIDELRSAGRVAPGSKNMMIGFGVGLSWAGCMWTP